MVNTLLLCTACAAFRVAAPPLRRRTIRTQAVPKALETDIRAYLAVRENALRTNATVDRGQEIRDGFENNPISQGANYLLSLDTFLPKDLNVDEYGRPKQLDALQYTELERYGFGRLVTPIMDAGGYAAVSKALGVAVSAPRAPPVPSDDIVRDGEQRGVSLGGSIEDKLAAISSLNATQIKLDKEAKLIEKAARRARAAAPKPKRADELVIRKTVRRKKKAAEAKVEKREWPAAAAPLALGAAPRAYAVLGLFLVAAPGAPATAQLLSQAGLSGDLGGLAPLGAAILAANVASAGLVAFRGPERPAFAVLRALVGGPLVLLEEPPK